MKGRERKGGVEEIEVKDRKRNGEVRKGTDVGKVIVVLIPPGHILFGKVTVSSPVQGAPPKGLCSMLCSHRWQICFCIPRLARRLASPTSMRKPWCCLLVCFPSGLLSLFAFPSHPFSHPHLSPSTSWSVIVTVIVLGF